MFFRVTSIDFDFEMDPGKYPAKKLQEKVTTDALKVWEAEDEGELADVISDETGWCIFGMDYEEVQDTL